MGEVLHAVEALVLQLLQVLAHDTEGVGAANAGEDGVSFTTGRTSAPISTTIWFASP